MNPVWWHMHLLFGIINGTYRIVKLSVIQKGWLSGYKRLNLISTFNTFSHVKYLIKLLLIVKSLGCVWSKMAWVSNYMLFVVYIFISGSSTSLEYFGKSVIWKM